MDQNTGTTLTFDGKEGSPISLATAQAMTKNFRGVYPTATKAVFFGKDLLNQILGQSTDTMGIRFYFAMDSSNQLTLVIVGANSSGNDQTDGIIGDMAVPCPQVCDTSSPLNDVETEKR